jgi:hypothetical protein
MEKIGFATLSGPVTRCDQRSAGQGSGTARTDYLAEVEAAGQEDTED